MPKINHDISKVNFVFSLSLMWNSLISKVLNTSVPENNGILVTGSSKNSDMSAPIQFVKAKLKNVLLEHQKAGDTLDWIPVNFFNP